MDLLLPAAISLAALGLVVAIILWLRHRRGRALQAFGFAALPVGLYLTGLLGLVFSAAAALGRWAGQLIFNPAVWAGLGLLGVTVVLWVIGGIAARRSRAARKNGQTAVTKSSDTRAERPAVGRAPSTPKSGTATSSPSGGGTADGEFDDIEELLRKRGIE